MPIVFVHGAGTREHYRKYHADITHVVAHLRHYVAPAIANDPERVTILVAYWGDLGVALRSDGLSVPLAPPLNLCNHPLLALLPARHSHHIAREVWRRTTAMLGYMLGRLVALIRRPQTKLTALFIGDALHYFAQRGSTEHPGPIPLRVLETLAQASAIQRRRPGEPLIIFSHSLGGAIVYDLVSYFLPRLPAYQDIQIDFWASLASQIGLFEEMQLFLASDPAYGPGIAAPFPDRRFLTHWWNVWDPNDVLSFTVRGVIQGVDDEAFDSGLSVGAAHLACLRISSFYAVLGAKIAATLRARR